MPGVWPAAAGREQANAHKRGPTGPEQFVDADCLVERDQEHPLLDLQDPEQQASQEDPYRLSEDSEGYPRRGITEIAGDSVAKQVSKVSLDSRAITAWYLIDPVESRFLVAWDSFVVILLIVVAFLAPFEAAFLTPAFDTLFVVNRVIDVVFVVDMILQFFMVRMDENNKPIRSICRIGSSYLRGWFIFDFISCIPFDLIVMLRGKKRAGPVVESLRSLKAVRLVRFLRLIRLLRLSNFNAILLRWHAAVGVSFAWLALVKFLFMILGACHLMACLWGFLGTLESAGKETWLVNMDKGEHISEAWHIYALSMYWAVMTLTSIGYGDVVPNTLTEYIVCTCCMLMMSSIWAYLIGAVCSIVATMSPHDSNFRQSSDALNEFMDDFDMSPDLRKKLRRYFYESKDVLRQNAEKRTIDQLSPALQGEVLFFVHHKWLSKIWYFREIEIQYVAAADDAGHTITHSFLTEASRKLELKLFAPNEYVTKERSLFIVRRGIALRTSAEAFAEMQHDVTLPRPAPDRACCTHPQDGKPPHPLGHYERRWPRVYIAGSHWGEDFFLSNTHLRDESPALALLFLEVITFDVTSLIEVLQDFPEVKMFFLTVRTKLALVRAVKTISRVLRHARDHSRKHLSSEDEEMLVQHVLNHKLELVYDPSSGFVGGHNGDKPRAMKHRRHTLTHMHVVHKSGRLGQDEKAQPVVARLDDVDFKVSQLTHRQERVEAKLDAVIDLLSRLSGDDSIQKQFTIDEKADRWRKNGRTSTKDSSGY